MSQDGPIGVALLNMGGPASEAEIAPFLRELLGDRAMVPLPAPLRGALAHWVSSRRAPKVAEHYRAIGGKSPVLAETARQVDALSSALGDGYRVQAAFRYAPPKAAAALDALREAGARRVVALPAYPHWSSTTSGTSVDDLVSAARRRGMQWREAAAYPSAAGLISALWARLKPHLNGEGYLLMTAHGLPERVVRKGDPYVEHVEQTARLLSRRLPAGTPWSLAFQSRLGPVRWLRPYVDSEIERLAAEGVRRLVLVPLTFACENLETRYELDIQMAELAARCGITEFHRAEVPGDHPAFIETLAQLVHETAQGAGWENGNGA